MSKGQRLKPEQIVTLLRQIDVLTTNFKPSNIEWIEDTWPYDNKKCY